jgi:hypothetical protein
MQGMVPPWPWLAPTPPLPPTGTFGHSSFRVDGTGKPASVNTLDVLGNTPGLFGLSGGGGDGRLLRQLTGAYNEKAQLFNSEPPLSVFHGHWAGDTAPVSAPWRLLPGPPWLVEQERQHLPDSIGFRGKAPTSSRSS